MDWMKINLKKVKDLINTKVNISDIKDNLTSSDTNKPLSAKQGKTLQDTKLNKNANDTSTGYITAAGFKVANKSNFLKADGTTADANNYSHPSGQQCTHNHDSSYIKKTADDSTSYYVTAKGFKVSGKSNFLKADGTTADANNYTHPSGQQCTHNHDSSYIKKTADDSTSYYVTAKGFKVSGKSNFLKADGTTADANNYTHPSAQQCSHTHQTLASGTLADFAALITNATSGATITLDRDYKAASGQGNITISKNIKIIGNGHVIDLNGINRLAIINSGYEVEFSDVKIINGAISAYGGVFHNTGTLKLHNCIFANNKANNGDGGVMNIQAGITMITDCLFVGNSSSGKGGVINNYYSGSKLLVTNSTFINNTAASHAGAIRNASATECILIDCNFIKNTAGTGSNYGTIHTDNNTLSLYNCIFKDNTAGGYASVYSGAAITSYNCTYPSSSTYNVTNRTYSLDNHTHSYAPINHAIDGATYGKSSASVFGHAKLSDSYTGTANAASTGIAASNKAVVDAYADLTKKCMVNVSVNSANSSKIPNSLFTLCRYGHQVTCQFGFQSKLTGNGALTQPMPSGYKPVDFPTPDANATYINPRAAITGVRTSNDEEWWGLVYLDADDQLCLSQQSNSSGYSIQFYGQITWFTNDAFPSYAQ